VISPFAISFSRSPRAAALGAWALFFVMVGPASARGQVIPDTIPPPDTIQVVETPGDTLGLQTAADSISPEDTIPAAYLPELTTPHPAAWSTGVWEWDREGILGSRAVTLAGLLSEIPGVVPLRGGDLGMPVSVTAFGAGGGRVRVFRDGVEMLPLEGSVTDLARVGLSGLESVRVIRAVGEVRIEVKSIFSVGGRPYSFIEAGTGDLNTNILRGTFAHPRALGGVAHFSMERLDTQGPLAIEPGVSQGASFRYGRSLWGRGVIALDYYGRSTDRGTIYDPKRAGRSDLSLRTRWELPKGFVADLFYASSSAGTEKPDTFPFLNDSRTQVGALVSFESSRFRALSQVRRLSGEGLPGTAARLEAAAGVGRYGGLGGEYEWESWEERSVSRNRIRAWTAPLFGLSLFGERGSGDWGVPYLPARQSTPPDSVGEGEEPPAIDTFAAVVPGPRFGTHKGTRYGLEFNWRGLSLAGARLKVESDSLFLLGLPTDRSGATAPGGTREGFEVSARIPLYPQGLSLVGSYQRWDQLEDAWTTPEDSAATPEPVPEDQAPWRYLPRFTYQGALSFHNAFLPTGNLEVWFDGGVWGREPMAVPFPEEVEVGEEIRLVQPMVQFYQSWYLRLQIRVVTVRAFFMWENITLREGNQDFPGRLQPATRSVYGIRWTLWN
jgi:hypothetical protein